MQKHKKNIFICYYRVSTRRQNLGIDAQRTECAQYVQRVGGVILCEYSEKESGKDTGNHYANRPQLVAALEECVKAGAVLLVAKVDRLTRDLEDGAHLCKNYNIEFCDHPEMNDPIMQGMYFGLAMQERQYISERIRAALQELKQNGKQLGHPRTHEELHQMALKSIAVRREAATNHRANKMAWAVVSGLGDLPASVVARRLNASGFLTIRGNKWTGKAVANLRELMKDNKPRPRLTTGDGE